MRYVDLVSIFQEANSLYGEGKYFEACEKYNFGVDNIPNYMKKAYGERYDDNSISFVHNNLLVDLVSNSATTYMKLKQYDEAIKRYLYLFKEIGKYNINPPSSSISALFNLSLCYLNVGNRKMAYYYANIYSTYARNDADTNNIIKAAVFGKR